METWAPEPGSFQSMYSPDPPEPSRNKLGIFCGQIWPASYVLGDWIKLWDNFTLERSRVREACYTGQFWDRSCWWRQTPRPEESHCQYWAQEAMEQVEKSNFQCLVFLSKCGLYLSLRTPESFPSFNDFPSPPCVDLWVPALVQHQARHQVVVVTASWARHSHHRSIGST